MSDHSLRPSGASARLMLRQGKLARNPQGSTRAQSAAREPDELFDAADCAIVEIHPALSDDDSIDTHG